MPWNQHVNSRGNRKGYPADSAAGRWSRFKKAWIWDEEWGLVQSDSFWDDTFVGKPSLICPPERSEPGRRNHQIYFISLKKKQKKMQRFGSEGFKNCWYNFPEHLNILQNKNQLTIYLFFWTAWIICSASPNTIYVVRSDQYNQRF